jgi:hypothetical protein
MVGCFITQVKLHGHWGPILEMSDHRTWIRMPDRLLGSQVSMWRVPGMVIEVATFFSSACLAAKPSHMAAEVDRSDCRLHQPMAYGQQTRTHGHLKGVILSYHTMEIGEGRSHLARV